MTSGAQARLRVAVHPDWSTAEQNPYLTALCRGLADRGVAMEPLRMARHLHDVPDVVHLHWPESALRNRSAFRAALRVSRQLTLWQTLRARGAKLVWTMHNIEHHERRHPRIETRFWRLFHSMVDGVICLTEHSAVLLHQRSDQLAHVPVAIIRHGHYRDAYMPIRVPARRARSAVGAGPRDGVTLMFFGQVRRYKNVTGLLAAFAEWQAPTARLIVAGAAKEPAYAETLQRMSMGDDRVTLDLRHVHADDVADRFAIADLVVLPFDSVLNSGSALLALSMDRPVLVPRTPTFEELARDVGSGWIQFFTPPLRASDLACAVDGARRLDGRPDLSRYEWAEVIDATLAQYGRVVGGS
jgi:beta-1,4-mannosyltransferase